MSYCPKCNHHSNRHVGGTCYSCQTINCMVGLGRGNKWGRKPGWYTGEELNETADRINPKDRPYTRFL